VLFHPHLKRKVLVLWPAFLSFFFFLVKNIPTWRHFILQGIQFCEDSVIYCTWKCLFWLYCNFSSLKHFHKAPIYTSDFTKTILIVRNNLMILHCNLWYKRKGVKSFIWGPLNWSHSVKLSKLFLLFKKKYIYCIIHYVFYPLSTPGYFSFMASM